jgi:phosphoglycolate phosphatase-like HAD superfamily hydrolase
LTIENHHLRVDAVIFDLDGTLIDSAPIYYELIDIIFARLDIPPVSKKVLLEAMKDGEFEWDLVLPDGMRPRKEEVIKTARTIIDDIAPSMFSKDVKLIPGTVDAFNEIAAEGMKLAVATSTLRDYMAVKLAPLREAGLENLLEVIVTADDVRHKKPHAEPLLKCSVMLGLDPIQCVYVGDTRVDIRAGKAAGMRTVGVLTGFDGYDALKNEKPTVIINSIADLRAALV